MKKVVVIGANSYIARNVICVLKRDYDYEIKMYDYAKNQKDGEQNYSQINILDRNSVSQIDFNSDIVFMFVRKSGTADGFDEFNTFIDINEKSLLTVLNEMRRQQSKAKIIFPSTRLVYKGSKFPLKEDSEKEFRTIYAINKFACEAMLNQYHNIFDIDYCVFRICIPYGTLIKDASAYGTAEFMLNRARQGKNILLYGGGSQRRTLTYMEDLCKALIEGAINDKCQNDIFNIGGEVLSLFEMASLLASIYGVQVENIVWPEISQKIESGDTVFDSSKFDRLNLVSYRMKFSDWCLTQKGQE